MIFGCLRPSPHPTNGAGTQVVLPRHPEIGTICGVNTIFLMRNALLPATLFLLVSFLELKAADAPATPPSSFPVHIRVDAGKSLGPLRETWRFFGADEPNYAYFPNGSKLIGELGEMAPKQVYFRTHNLLNSGDGTPALKWGSTGVYSEDSKGRPVYNFSILDKIFDTYLSHGVRPYAEIGFMPQEFSTHPEPYQHRFGSSGGNTRSSPAGPIRRRITRNGTNSFINGRSIASSKYGRDGSGARGIGKPGTSRTSAIGTGRPKSFRSFTIMPSPGCGARCPRRVWADPTPRAAAGSLPGTFLEHCLRGTNYVTGKVGHAH